ncbi:CAMK family protein kinase [Tritrichomonas foetus]|uniref:CAMK family protein kinase n=1 Tax=Tritrichomonas foetus TaxID=1144522 RepID=A0A1J4KVT4_9EUKA|nr:CAMK family protein kinase [Tritrichomonas foetus]|eukprot:OHT15425.1 CAMK family protein kinase [Tritrichomonas foetus]
MQPERELIPEGTEIRNFVFLQKIGQGGYADVYKVTSKRFNLDFVAKVISCTSDKVLESTESEINSLQMLDHPNIIRLYDHFFWKDNPQGSPLFVMILEYCPNGSLMDEYKKNGPISGLRLLQITRQLITAVQYAHSMNIAHRDIKPQNILFDEFGRPKLADFGISHIIKDDQSKFTVNSKCSLRYAAPEVIEKKPHDEFKADVWSLGISIATVASSGVLYPLQTQQLMIDAIRLGNINLPKKLPSSLLVLLKKMIERDPNVRISMDEAALSPLEGLEQSCSETDASLLAKRSFDFTDLKRRGRVKSKNRISIGSFVLNGNKSTARLTCGPFTRGKSIMHSMSSSNANFTLSKNTQ